MPPVPDRSAGKSARILLVEDNSGDEFLFVDAFERSGCQHSLEVVRDGEEALDRLKTEGAFADSDVPDLVLLDLNLPKIDGREVLRRVKTDTRLKSIPILILSTSSSESDVSTCYADHANAYLTKPFDPGRYEEVIAAIDAFWCSAATLPAIPAAPRS